MNDVTWSEIFGGLTDTAKGYFSSKAQSDAAKAQLAATKAASASKLPAWLIPAGLGVGLLVLVIVLVKKS